MRSATWVIVGAMAVAVLCAAARAEEASVLMQEGVYEQDVAGDLDKAMAAYKKVIDNAQADRRYVAEAHFRLGKCYLAKGERERAQAEFRAVVERYADQQMLASAAGAELAKLGPPPTVVPASLQPPGVLKTVPEALSDAVSPDLKEITVTFDRAMVDGSWSWTGGGDTFPATTGKPYYDAGHTTCHLPVRLVPGHVYWVGVNSPSFQSFKTPDGVPARRYVILFATAGADGKPTPIPEQLAQQARQINSVAADREAPGVVKTAPEAMDGAVPPDLKEITVTFNQTMMDGSWSWTGGGDTFPEVTGKPYYDSVRATCHLPVKLQPGHVYWVGVNSPSHGNFKTPDGVPARRYVILFAAAGADGKPTPIPEDLAQRAREINAQGSAQRSVSDLADLRVRLAEAQAQLKAAMDERDADAERVKSLEESAVAGRTPQAEVDAARQELADADARMSAAARRVDLLTKATASLATAMQPVPTALDVAQRFWELFQSGKNDSELIGLTQPGTVRRPSTLPLTREYYHLSGATIEEFWLADQDACAVTSFFPTRQDGKPAAMGIGLRKNGDRWLVRDIDALPDKQKAAAFVQGFRDANPSARQVPIAPPAEGP